MTTNRRRSAAALLALCALVAPIAPAAAGVGGQVPGPSNCDYPGVGHGALVGVGTYFWYCDFPTEENGSHWHAEFAGVVGNGGVGISAVFLNAHVDANIGVTYVETDFRCPDNTLSAPPLHPGRWNNPAMIAVPCVSIGQAPQPPNASGPEDSAAPAVGTPAVTNPTPGNPGETENP